MRKLIKLTLIFTIIALVFPSCVSKKKFTELLSSKEAVDATLAQSQSKVKSLEEEKEALAAEMEAEKNRLNGEIAAIKADQDATKKQLATTKTTLSATEGQLASAEQSIKGVFSSYEGSGLNVVQRDNRLYVTMSEPITFRSGSTRIGKQHRDAIKSLGEILVANPGINIQVEGHSDNAKFIDGNGNNWNLSMSRAMNALNILLKAGVSPNQLSAVGRGEFAPVAADDPNSKEARAQNRRVEFVVTPNLSSLKP